MASLRDIRRLAFQALYQLDLTGGTDPQAARRAIEQSGDWTADDLDRALAMASAAYENRHECDQRMTELAPDWPAHRQAAVDRAILRLAYYEMISGQSPPKVVVNEAIELAKRFSTERSPSFINALLDKVLKDVLAAAIPSSEQQTAPEL